MNNKKWIKVQLIKTFVIIKNHSIVSHVWWELQSKGALILIDFLCLSFVIIIWTQIQLRFKCLIKCSDFERFLNFFWTFLMVFQNTNQIDFQLESDKQKIEIKSKRSQTIASIGFGIFGSLSVGLLVICLPFVWPAFRRHVLPYIPATDTQIDNVLQLVKRSKPKTLIDLGSGDGRLVCFVTKLLFH